jgi:hypothetical protein
MSRSLVNRNRVEAGGEGPPPLYSLCVRTPLRVFDRGLQGSIPMAGLCYSTAMRLAT